MPHFVSNNRHLREVLIFFFHSKKWRLKRMESSKKFTEILLWVKQRALIGSVASKTVISMLTNVGVNEFEPVSLQTQIPFNVQTKVQFKIPRIRNCSNPQKKDQLWTKKHYPNQTIMKKTNKKKRKEKKGNLPKPLSSFSFFRPLLSLLPTTIYIKKKNCQQLARRFSALPAPSSNPVLVYHFI